MVADFAFKKKNSMGQPLLNHLTQHEWLGYNFSLQYQYKIKQTRDENKDKY